MAGPGMRLLACLVILLASCQLAHTRSSTATLALLGDISLGRGVAQAHRDGGWEHALQALKPALPRASLAMANLESPLTAEGAHPNPTNRYNMCAAPDGLPALTAAGVDLLALANNHQNDCQPGGVQQTRRILENAGLAGISPGLEPLIREVNGLKLAFLAFDDVSQPLDEQPALEAVKRASLSADVVIVSMHWGVEYQAGPTARQRALAQSLAEAGADLIWGHHPHVLQPLQYLSRPDGQPPALAAYSLGNALFDQPGSPQANRSAILLVEINAQGVQAYEPIPFEIDPLNGVVQVPSREAFLDVNRILEAWMEDGERQ